MQTRTPHKDDEVDAFKAVMKDDVAGLEQLLDQECAVRALPVQRKCICKCFKTIFCRFLLLKKFFGWLGNDRIDDNNIAAKSRLTVFDLE